MEAPLGQGLFELRGEQVRLFYMFLPNRVAVLLDGEIKNRTRSHRRRCVACGSIRPPS
jgi:hypothetical protein